MPTNVFFFVIVAVSYREKVEKMNVSEYLSEYHRRKHTNTHSRALWK